MHVYRAQRSKHSPSAFGLWALGQSHTRHTAAAPPPVSSSAATMKIQSRNKIPIRKIRTVLPSCTYMSKMQKRVTRSIYILYRVQPVAA